MPKEIIRILGQSYPAAGVETVLYTVPANRRAIVKVIVFVNAAMSDTVSIATVEDGENDIPGNPTVIENYIVIGLVADTKQGASGGALQGITLSQNDDVRVKSDDGDTIFHCYGIEVEA